MKSKQDSGGMYLVLNRQGSDGVHTGRGDVSLCVNLCLRTSLMYDVYDCIESREMVE